MSKVTFDTNILFYAYDTLAPVKQAMIHPFLLTLPELHQALSWAAPGSTPPCQRPAQGGMLES